MVVSADRVEPGGSGTEGTQLPDAAELYLDLLKRALSRSCFGPSYRLLPAGRQLRHLPRRGAQKVLGALGLALVQRPDAVLRTEGKDWPAEADTMLGQARLDNVQHCVTAAITSGVAGDLIEAGVWRGGATILMRGVLKAYGVTDRRVWVADSFQGLPPPDAERYQEDRGDTFWRYGELAVSLEEVRANFARYGLLDDQVQFLPGWFEDTLASAPIERLAVLRVDGDMYASTKVALDALYPKVSRGGYVIVDDYGAVAGCRSATDEYRAAHGIEAPLREVDWTAVYWQKRE